MSSPQKAETGPAATLPRCTWPGINDAEYTRYHDEEWGVPIHDGRRLFEKLTLESFQSGLSWLTILRKRDNFRAAFASFDPARLASFDDADITRLMADTGIVRNRAKIEAAIHNARSYLKLTSRIDFADFIWGYVDNAAIINAPREMSDVPATTPQSQELSKALKAEGFKFIGPTTMYALMQSAGLVNDHLATCHRHVPCKALQQTPHTPKNP